MHCTYLHIYTDLLNPDSLTVWRFIISILIYVGVWYKKPESNSQNSPLLYFYAKYVVENWTTRQ